ncbi:MAG: YabP/YqfC family sporulation protein [Peptococcaceae bacterium]|nr:YabP/YqfC family sporulation protein [Peptococcaceae bacterium]
MAGERKQGVGRFLDMSQDALLDLPKVVMTGRFWAGIENHRGIVEYSADKIRIAVNSGEIGIHGRNLTIERFNRDEIAIEGLIFSVDFGVPYLEEEVSQ